MQVKIIALRQIYREETRFDWPVFLANVMGAIIVLAATLHAHSATNLPPLTAQIASVVF